MIDLTTRKTIGDYSVRVTATDPSGTYASYSKLIRACAFSEDFDRFEKTTNQWVGQLDSTALLDLKTEVRRLLDEGITYS